jgi:PAS domain S-box-containing protein
MTRVPGVQRQLEIAQQITHVGSWQWDLATDTIGWSDELYRIYGLVPGAVPITLDLFFSCVHPDDRDRLRREVAATVEQGGRFEWRERIVRPDGSIRCLETIGEAECDPSGRVVSLVGTCRDVTDEREREDQLRTYADLVRSVQIGLSVWSGGGGDEPPILVAYNPACEAIAGESLRGSVGKPLREIAPYAADGVVESLLAAVGRERVVRETSIERSRDSRHPTRALAVKAFPLPGERVGLALEDVTAATVERRLQKAEHAVLEMVAQGAPLGETLSTLVRAIEERAPPVLGSILLLDPDGLHLRHGAAPNLPATFQRAIDGHRVGPRAGCGTAVFLKRPVVVEDIEREPFWEEYRDLARAHGLRACWSVPVHAANQRVLGTFALYYRTPRSPRAGELTLLERAARLAGIAIERKELEQQLRDLSGHIEAALEDERTGIAREIHDELGQALTALKMDIAWIARRATAEEAVSREALLDKLGAMSNLADALIECTRRISAELRPGVLDDLGLIAAVEWQAADFEARTGIACKVSAKGSDETVGRSQSTAAFRVFQEALTNVARHARATRVQVSVAAGGGALFVEVVDNGAGISLEAACSPKSLGLLGMRERARRFGGSVAIVPLSLGGTKVTLNVPLASLAPADETP